MGKDTIEIQPNYLSTGCFMGSRLLEARPEGVPVASWRATIVSFGEHFRYLSAIAKDTPEGELSDYEKLLIHIDTYWIDSDIPA